MSSRLTVQIYVILSEYEKTGKGTLLGAKKVIRHILAKETAFRWQGNGVSSPTIPRIVPEPKKQPRKTGGQNVSEVVKKLRYFCSFQLRRGKLALFTSFCEMKCTNDASFCDGCGRNSLNL